MEEPPKWMSEMVGRDSEIATLKQHLADAMAGKGSTVLISGEPGIGKTRLVEEFRKHAEETGARILSGAAMSGSAQPFQVFSKALEGVTDKPLFEEQEYTSFTEIFAVNSAGLLLAKASSEEGGLDADIFAGMLSAVQDFVRDSFGQEGGKAGLGRLEYGDMKILIEHGQHLFLTAVFSGNEHPEMKNTVKHVLKSIEESHDQLIEKWSGKMSEIEPVQNEITTLAGARFLVRKDLEGVKLENERIRIADRVLETLAQLSHEKTLVLFMEDLHWADESSLFVLNYLARNIRKSPVLLLGTSRPGESDTLEKAIESMKNEEIIEEMNLVKLDMEFTNSLINTTFRPNDFPDSLTERLYEQSKGNPLFVTEMLKGMLQDGSIAEKDGKYTLISESYTVPATVEEVVNRRLDVLDPDSMAMVEYASCIGQKFEESLAASNRMIKDANASIEKLLDLEILQRKNGSLEFSHAIFRSVIYNGIGDRWKMGHHRSIGECLETAYADRLEEVIYSLARHFSLAKAGMKAVDYCILAADRAWQSFAPEQVVELCKMGIGCLPNNAKTVVRAPLYERQGDAYTLAGYHTEALTAYEDAVKTEIIGEPLARLHGKRAKILERVGDLDAALAAVDEGKRNVMEGSMECFSLDVMMATILITQGNQDNAIFALVSVISKLSERSDSESLLAQAHQMIGKAFSRKGDIDSSYKHDELCLSIRQKMGDEYGIALILNNMAITHYMRGDQVNAAKMFEESIRIRERIGDKYGLAATISNLGSIYFARGEWDKTLELSNQSLAIKRKIGDKNGISMSLDVIGLVKSEMGYPIDALNNFLESIQIKEPLGDLHSLANTLGYTGNTYIDMDELDKALETQQHCLEIREKIGDEIGITLSYNNMGNIAELKGDFTEAERLYQLAKERAKKLDDKASIADNLVSLADLYSEGYKFEISRRILKEAEQAVKDSGIENKIFVLQRIEAVILAREKKFSEAEKFFEAAVGGFESIHSDGQIATTLYKWAVTMGKNYLKSRKLLERALSITEQRGLMLIAERCRKALQELEQ